MSDLETKEKIMNAARLLFADRGYEGTSVREIAKVAEVNIASLNYYFATKENLFHEIIKTGYNECAVQIKDMLEKNMGNLENTLTEFFHYYIENSPDLLTHFKLMMSPQHSSQISSQGTEDGNYGPPGGMVITGSLKTYAPQATDEDLHWALKTLFSHVCHLALIHTCCIRNNSEIPYSSVNDLEKSVRRVTRMVLSELKAPQHNASSLLV